MLSLHPNQALAALKLAAKTIPPNNTASQKNKEAAASHLLAMQLLLSRKVSK